MASDKEHISGALASATAGDTLQIRQIASKESIIAQFIVQGTFVGTIEVQANQPGKTTEWVTMENGVFTAPAVRNIEIGASCDIRVTCTAYTSGTANYRISVN